MIENLILEKLREIGEESNNKALINASIETSLYGSNRNMDSLTLVRFISEMEDAIYDNYNIEVVIANEKAMSMKNSPFLTVTTFEKYLKELIEEAK